MADPKDRYAAFRYTSGKNLPTLRLPVYPLSHPMGSVTSRYAAPSAVKPETVTQPPVTPLHLHHGWSVLAASLAVLAAVVGLLGAAAPQPRTVTQPPVTLPAVLDTPPAPVSAPTLAADAVDPEPPPEWMVVPALLTAYTPGPESCGPDADGRTSTMRKTDDHPYGIAADNTLLPAGTRVRVPEYMSVRFPDRAWEVDDTGGAMRQNRRRYHIVHLDLRYRTVYSALKVEPQWADVTVDVSGWSEADKARLRRAAQNGQRMREQGRLP